MLLLEDTWVSGASAQSAAAALKRAGRPAMSRSWCSAGTLTRPIRYGARWPARLTPAPYDRPSAPYIHPNR